MDVGKGAAGTGAVPSAGRRSRILVVDDEPDLREALHDLLAAAIDADVVTAGSGKQGLQMAQKETFDLVLSDYKMPEMDGLEFLAKMSREAPEVPRVMITAYPDQNLAIQAINDAKIETFLTKPLDPGEVVRVVRGLLEKRKMQTQRNAAFLKALRPGAAPPDEERAALEARCIAPLDKAITAPGVEAAIVVGRDGVSLCARSRAAFDLETAAAMGAASFAAAEVAAGSLGEPTVERLLVAMPGRNCLIMTMGNDHLFLVLAEPSIAPTKLAVTAEELSEPLQLILVKP